MSCIFSLIIQKRAFCLAHPAYEPYDAPDALVNNSSLNEKYNK